MSIQAVVFDLDGTLSNTLDSIAGFANEALVTCGQPAIETEIYKLLIGGGRDSLIRRMLRHIHGQVDDALYEQVGAVYDRLYAADPMRDVTVYPGIFELLQALRERDIPCAVLSNKPDDMTRAVAAGLFPADTFAVVQGQRADIPKKPAPDGVYAVLAPMGVAPENCLYVGDTGSDMVTAKNAGAVAAGVLWGFRGEEELRRDGADVIAANPQELLQFIDANR